MKNYVYEMCFSDNKKRHMKLTDSVLLAPAWDSSITKKANREIKSASFQFLKTVNHKVSIILQYCHNCLIHWCNSDVIHYVSRPTWLSYKCL